MAKRLPGKRQQGGPPAAPLRPLLSPGKPWSVRSVGHYTCTSLRSSLSITESVYKEGTGASCLSLAMVTCSALVRQAAHWLSLMQRVRQLFWNWSLLSQKAHQGPSEKELVHSCLFVVCCFLITAVVSVCHICVPQTDNTASWSSWALPLWAAPTQPWLQPPLSNLYKSMGFHKRTLPFLLHVKKSVDQLSDAVFCLLM